MQLDESASLTPETQLLGGFSEFNSLTITTLIVEIEEAVDCEIDDEEISAEVFETVGSLAAFVDKKMAQS